MYFIDTHCHLNFDSYQQNINQVVDNALENGVNRIIVPGLDLETSEIAVELASRFECVFAAVGVHPSDIQKYKRNQFSSFEKLAVEKKAVAVGEIGLDLFHHPESLNAQLEVLDSMLDLAISSHQPVILHSRQSLDLLVERITKWDLPLKNDELQYQGVFHSFEGTFSDAEKVKNLGMFVGIGGPITFRNALDKQSLVKECGLENLVLETDSPFLSPYPYRGQTNEPSRIPIIAQKVADLLELTIEEVAVKTSHNAHLLFRLEQNL